MNSEIRLGEAKLKIPNDLSANPVARKKFRELMKIYEGCNYVSSSDLDIMGEYCKVFAEIISYEEQMKDIKITDDCFVQLDSWLDRKRDLLVKLQDRIF